MELGQSRIERYPGIVTVKFSDAILASSDEALILHEEGHEPAYYIPFKDVYFEFLQPSRTRRRCPRKGEARYWNVSAVGEAETDVMWGYEIPEPGYDQLCDHASFDPSKVAIESAERGEVERVLIRDS